jgi:hypothetical protein
MSKIPNPDLINGSAQLAEGIQPANPKKAIP